MKYIHWAGIGAFKDIILLAILGRWAFVQHNSPYQTVVNTFLCIWLVDVAITKQIHKKNVDKLNKQLTTTIDALEEIRTICTAHPTEISTTVKHSIRKAQRTINTIKWNE